MALDVDGDEPCCYVTTTGRVTGRAHTVEIWFGLHGDTLYMLSGGGRRADWVRNILCRPTVLVRVGNHTFGGRARVVAAPDEDARARHLLFSKYASGYAGDLTSWRDSALPVAVDVTGETASDPGR